MTGIEVNIDNLDKHIGDIKGQQETAQLLENVTEPEPAGKGLVEEELAAYNKVCNALLKDLDLLYQKVGAFLSCTRDGIVTSDEYAAKLTTHSIGGGNDGAAG